MTWSLLLATVRTLGSKDSCLSQMPNTWCGLCHYYIFILRAWDILDTQELNK